MLSRDDMNAFAVQGFLGPYDLPEAVQAEFAAPDWLGRVRRALNGKILDAEAMRNQHLYSQSLVDLVTTDAILDGVRSMLGDDILLWVAHVMARRPGAGGQKWHSDSINQFIRGIHVSISLTEMNRRNGCLSVIPGTHLYRASLWAQEDSAGLKRGDADAVRQLADKVAPWNAPHEVRHMEVGPGQFFYTWGGLWHGVGPNRTKETRMACVARYLRPDFRCCDYGFRDDRITVGELQPCLLVHGSDRYHLNDVHPHPAADIFT